MTSTAIRQQFLDFFRNKGHQVVASAPIVVKNDPTLMFTNAGMNQFKDYFLGNKPAPYPRVVDTQKCLRVSGKHNDLEEVGVDTYHHTMFEMLGNWSFGDYFKADAIAWSWELLTEVFKIEKNRLYVSVFEGDATEGLPFDQEAHKEWKKHIAEDRILKGKKKDNFWEMGETGPCGPCSEIHVDCRSDADRNAVDGKTLVNADDPQVIEIWNNVFIQFNRKKDGSLEPLPAKHVDTGMGFERLVRVLQNKSSNYDTDVFTGTLAAIEKITGKIYDPAATPETENTTAGKKWKEAVAFRVLADHIRAICFTIADGQLPSNTGAGYVIRRILRRAVRYYYSYLEFQHPLLHQLVPVLATQFEEVFPELKKQELFVSKVIHEEEEAFLRTVEKGLKRIDDIIKTSNQVIDGKSAFELYDTYGFPVDLTRLIASENSLSLDEAGFELEMQQQKSRSRAATTIDTEDWQLVGADVPVKFVGYNDLNVTTHVIKYRRIKAKGKEQYQIVLAETPFYAESGGQVGDKGTLTTATGTTINVVDTKKENDLIIHYVDILPDSVEEPVVAVVDFQNRLNTMYNHTGTHLLHAALRQVLGTHVQQKGSLVSPELLRFDVSHFAKITDEELRQVMQLVNEKIRDNISVVIKEMPKEEAMQLGAMALFGEKYGDTVRVVIADPDFSVELCGGTHVAQTGMLGMLVITSEAAIAAGVRRIEALTGPLAFRYVSEKIQQNRLVADLLKGGDPIKAVEKLLQEKAVLEKKVEVLETKELAAIRKNLLEKAEQINKIHFIGGIVEVSHADALKRLCGDLKNHFTAQQSTKSAAPNEGDFIAVLCAQIAGKASVAIAISDHVVASKGLDAGSLIKQQVAPLIKGGGGGQKFLATAGGQDAGNLKQVIEKIRSLIV